MLLPDGSEAWCQLHRAMVFCNQAAEVKFGALVQFESSFHVAGHSHKDLDAFDIIEKNF